MLLEAHEREREQERQHRRCNADSRMSPPLSPRPSPSHNFKFLNFRPASVIVVRWRIQDQCRRDTWALSLCRRDEYGCELVSDKL